MPPLRGSIGVMGFADLGLAPQAIQIAPLRGAFGKTLQPRVPDCMRAYLGNPVLSYAGVETSSKSREAPCMDAIRLGRDGAKLLLDQLGDELGRADQRRLEMLLERIEPDARIRLSEALFALYPGQDR